MRPDKNDYRLLSSFLLLQLERCALCIFLVAHSVNGVDWYSEVAPLIVCFHNTAFALRVDFYFEVSLNKNSNYCYIPRSSKHTDTCKWSGRVF